MHRLNLIERPNSKKMTISIDFGALFYFACGLRWLYLELHR